MILRSGFTIEGINIITKYSSDLLNYFVFRPFELQNSVFNLTNVDTRTNGALIYTNDRLSFYLKNMMIDLYRARSGIFLETDCYVGNAYQETFFYSYNLTFYYSQERDLSFPLDNRLFAYIGDSTIFIDSLRLYCYTSINSYVILFS